MNILDYIIHLSDNSNNMICYKNAKREKIKKLYKDKKIYCDCGSSFTKNNKRLHDLSIKHIRYLKLNNLL